MFRRSAENRGAKNGRQYSLATLFESLKNNKDWSKNHMQQQITYKLIQTWTCEAFNTDKVSSESTCLLSVHCAPPCQGQINSSCSIGTCSIWCCMAYRHMLIYCRHRIDTYKGTWELKFVQCCRIWMWCGLFDYVHICLLFVFVLFSIALHIRLLF